MLCKIPFIHQLIASSFTPKNIEPTTAFGLTFRNKVGLGAGFDKNANYLNELAALGFGFVEIGTVTPLPQEGNPKPRLFRLTNDKALVNRMGFNNDGVDVVAQRLDIWRKKNASKLNTRLIIGGNIGKNKVTPNELAWKDYETCFRILHPFVDYFVVNVSSPNTPGLRALQDKDSLKKILTNLQTLNPTLGELKPILLKIAPDLHQEQVNEIIELALEIKLDGLVVANTTIDRTVLSDIGQQKVQTIGEGGLSGAPLLEKSNSMLQYIHNQTNGSILVIGSGGIFTKQNATAKLDAGATLIQVWTGFIYEGPKIVKNICN